MSTVIAVVPTPTVAIPVLCMAHTGTVVQHYYRMLSVIAKWQFEEARVGIINMLSELVWQRSLLQLD